MGNPPGGSGGGGFGQPPGGGGGGFGQPPGGDGQPPGYPPGYPPAGGQPSPWDAQQNAQLAHRPPGGERAVEVGEIFDAFKVAIKRASTGVLGVYLAVSALRFVGTAPTWVVQYFMMDNLASGNFRSSTGLSAANLCTSGLSLVVAVIAGTLSIGLMSVVRKQMVEGDGAITGFADAFAIARERFWLTMGGYLLFAVAIAFGAILCIIPGLAAAFLFAFAPYLVATGNAEVIDSFKRSFELAKKNVGPLMVGIVAIIGVAIVIALLNLGIVAGMTAALGAAGIAIASAIVFFIGVAVGYVIYVFMSTLFVVCETADSGVPLRT
jgi:hypothetical protein